MSFLFCALTIAGAALTTTVHASDADAVRRTLTSSPSYAGDRRAGPTATITWGPDSDYVASLASNAPNPSGTSFTIVPAGDGADDGLNLILGPDLRTQLDKKIKESCSDTRSQECHDAILNLLPIQDVAIQRRQVGLLVNIGRAARYVFAAIAGAIAGAGTAQVAKAYHAPAKNLDQANAIASASAFAFISSATPSPTIVSVQPSDTPDPTPAAGPGDGKGFTFTVPQDLSTRTDDFISQAGNGKCDNTVTNKRYLTASRFNKRLDGPIDAELAGCLIVLTVTLVRNMVAGPLAEWVRFNRNNRQIAPAGAGAAVILADVNNQVAPLQAEVGLADDQWRAVQQAAFWESYNRLVLRQREGALQKYNPFTPFSSTKEFEAFQKALLSLKDIPDTSSIPDHCELRKRDDLYVMDRAFYESLARKACKDYPGDPSESFDVKLTNKDADPQYANQYQDYTIEFKWEDKPGACDPLTCTQIFTSFDQNLVCTFPLQEIKSDLSNPSSVDLDPALVISFVELLWKNPQDRLEDPLKLDHEATASLSESAAATSIYTPEYA
ncbi:MAG: hypothetical protein Q9160_008623 [Pyrenula sp. 1 TL-2023]